MKRRDFIKSTVPAALLPSFLGGFSVKAFAENPALNTILGAQTDTDRVLVCIFLSGGNDGINTVIPLDQYSTLSNARSNVLIPQNQVLSLNGTSNTGLHPMMTGMQELYNQNKLQIIQSVGYPSPNFSHFRSTDIWTSASDSNQVLTSGWVGRYLDTDFPGYPSGYPNAIMPDPLAIQIGMNLPLMFQGAAANMVMTVNSPSIFNNWATGTPDPVPNTNAGNELAYLRLIANQTQQYAQGILSAYISVTSQYSGYPAPGTNYLADALKAVAKLIKGGLKTRVYLVGIGGFDTHASQVDSASVTTGSHATLLKNLSDAIYAFQMDMEYLQIQDRVMGMTFSEFGRRIQSNASLGTDHGAAGPLFLFGSKVQGGILGSNPVIPANTTVNDNLPMQYDFRSVYASILKDWFCVPQSDLDAILLNNFQPLPVVNADCTGVSIGDIIQQQDLISISNYPNPFSQKTTLRFETLGGHASIQIMDALGRTIATPVEGKYAAGKHEIRYNAEALIPGNYYCRLQNGSLQKVTVMQVVRE